MPLGRRRRPGSCWGNAPGVIVGATNALHVVGGAAGASVGEEWLGGAAKLKALVRSPVWARRQALRFGTSEPKRVSRNRSVEVWSNVSEHTSPPCENGETTSIGTRKPRPIGPATPSAPAAVSAAAGAVR